MSKNDDHIYFEESWNEYVHAGYPVFPLRKKKRIKNELKRNKTKNNRSRSEGGGTTD